MKDKKPNYEEVLEKICELDGYLRGTLKQHFHDYKSTLDTVKALIKEKIADGR